MPILANNNNNNNNNDNIKLYHTPVKSGGLGILQLRQWMRHLRIRRLTGHRKNEFMADVLR